MVSDKTPEEEIYIFFGCYFLWSFKPAVRSEVVKDYSDVFAFWAKVKLSLPENTCEANFTTK